LDSKRQIMMTRRLRQAHTSDQCSHVPSFLYKFIRNSLNTDIIQRLSSG